MAKIQLKFDKVTPYGGIFSIMEAFSNMLEPSINRSLGLRSKFSGYQYGEILRSLACVYFCGGSCVEDVTRHLMPHLSLHPTLRTCSSDTFLRAIKELSEKNISYTSDSGKTYEFNTAERMNNLLLDCLLASGQIERCKSYDLDFDHQFIETEKYDAKNTYKHFKGYAPGIAAIGDLIVGIENRDGNANVRFHQADTFERTFTRMEARGISINRARMDCGSCSREIAAFYNQRGAAERIFDEMNNGFGWNRLPKSFMNENAVFLIMTAIIHNFYKKLMSGNKFLAAFGLKTTSRIKAFVFQICLCGGKMDKDCQKSCAQPLY